MTRDERRARIDLWWPTWLGRQLQLWLIPNKPSVNKKTGSDTQRQGAKPVVAVYGVGCDSLVGAVTSALDEAELPVAEGWMSLTQRGSGDLCVVLADLSPGYMPLRNEMFRDLEILRRREPGEAPRIVFVWVVPVAQRLKYGLAQLRPSQWDNLMSLFFTRSWLLGLSKASDEATAVRSLHERLLLWAGSISHGSLSGQDVRALYARLAVLDPDFVLSLCAQKRDGADCWNNVDAVVAATKTRWIAQPNSIGPE